MGYASLRRNSNNLEPEAPCRQVLCEVTHSQITTWVFNRLLIAMRGRLLERHARSFYSIKMLLRDAWFHSGSNEVLTGDVRITTTTTYGYHKTSWVTHRAGGRCRFCPCSTKFPDHHNSVLLALMAPETSRFVDPIMLEYRVSSAPRNRHNRYHPFPNAYYFHKLCKIGRAWLT